jgi:hypothetical protein
MGGIVEKTKLLKSVNDFVIGVFLFALGLFVLTTKWVVDSEIRVTDGGFWVRPDVYVRLIGGLISVCSAILILKSLNFRRQAETMPFRFVICREVVFTAAALIAYAFLLTRIGFAISTFLLTLFLTCVYIRKEKQSEKKPLLTLKDLIVAVVYSGILDAVVWLIFSKVLHVALP